MPFRKGRIANAWSCLERPSEDSRCGVRHRSVAIALGCGLTKTKGAKP